MRDTYNSLPIYHFSEEIKKNYAKKKLRAVIFGNFGVMNSGDEAILAGEIAELKKIPNITLTVVSRFPTQIKRIHGLPAVSFYAPGAVMREVRKADFVVVGGGGLISKLERGFLGFCYQFYMISLFFLIPRLYKKKLFAMGLGIYRNANPLVLQFALIALKNATAITVRDFHSQDLLKHKGVHSRIFKDNSFLMDLWPTRKILSDNYIQKHYSKEKMNIGISLFKPEKKADERKLLTEMAQFIAKNYTRADFWFFSLDSHPGYSNDEQFGQRLYELAKKKAGKDVRFHFVPKEWEPQKAFAVLSLMNYVITMRLHGAIFSYRLNKKFTGISYDIKGSNFLTSIGKESLSVKHITSKFLQTQIPQK